MPSKSLYQKDISIHAPRGGSDLYLLQNTMTHNNFNPRSPWGERRGSRRTGSTIPQFQSTLPVGGATESVEFGSPTHPFQSTLPVGGATAADYKQTINALFQSTLPVGGATTLARARA